MTDEHTYDLGSYALADHEHQSGCPARPERQEPELVRGEDEEAYVQRGVSPSGEPVMVRTWLPGPPSVKVRCLDCGVQRLFPVTEDEVAGFRTAVASG